MSQDASSHPVLWGSSPTASAPDRSPAASLSAQTRSVESHADQLLDEVFEDVEQLLEHIDPVIDPTGLSSSQPDNVQLDHALDEPASASSLGRSGSLTTVSGAIAPRAAEDCITSAITSETPPDPSPAAETQRPYDRLLLGAGCLSVLATLGIWLGSRALQRPPSPQANMPPAATPSPQDAASEFADYVQRSLQRLGQSSSTSGEQLPLAPVNSGTLPTVSVPTTSPSPSLQRPSSGLQRLYTPVLPPVPLPNRAATATLPGGQAGSNGAKSSGRSPSVAAVPSVPVVQGTLVGVLDLGENSAALIEIKGVTQRFRPGESINASGWTLVEVSNNQAIIRRNGEVRSVFIGQTF